MFGLIFKVCRRLIVLLNCPVTVRGVSKYDFLTAATPCLIDALHKLFFQSVNLIVLCTIPILGKPRPENRAIYLQAFEYKW